MKLRERNIEIPCPLCCVNELEYFWMFNRQSILKGFFIRTKWSIVLCSFLLELIFVRNKEEERGGK